jgi:predicted metal-dependent hydrolase
MITHLKYLTGYSLTIQNQIQEMITNKMLSAYLLSKYPKVHQIYNDKALRDYVMNIKNRFLKKSEPLSQIKYDDKIHVINNALGLH